MFFCIYILLILLCLIIPVCKFEHNIFISGANMNTFLNENWREILGELQSNFENALAAAFAGVAQQFFSRVPYNQVFKD